MSKSCSTIVTYRRAKGNYAGLVTCVAKERERITTQSQAEVHLRFTATAPDVDMEDETVPEEVVKSQLSNNQGVVTLIPAENQKEMVSSESEDDVEVIHHIPNASAISRTIEVGKHLHIFTKQSSPKRERMISTLIFNFDHFLDLGDDSEEEPVMLVTQ